jgi:hypothetical protein
MDKKQKEIMDQLLKKLVDKYSLEPEKEFDNSLHVAREMLACQLLIEEIEESIEAQEDTKDDAFKVLSYMTVVANARKLRLDWMKAYEDFGINQLVEKYVDFEMKGNLKNEE